MMNKVTFGAGCFWGVEDMFHKIPGVTETAAGYMGGTKDNPTYEDVCSHKTGHVEVVEVTFDPSIITYKSLLTAFWQSHDPTTPNQQGPDYGSQYRSVVFYYDLDQKNTAEEFMHELEKTGRWNDPIVTEILPAKEFWRAEEYHQQYFAKKGVSGTCHS